MPIFTVLYNQNAESEAFQHIAETFKAANIPARSATTSSSDSSQDGNDVTCWCMTDDGSLELPDNSSYSWVRLEVKSPALYVCQSAFEQVAAACEILTTKYRVCPHQSAGLHVHVGKEANGFPITVLRNFMSTIFTFEDRIEKIHPKHRVEDNHYALPLRTNSILAERLNAQGGLVQGESKTQLGLELLLKAGDEKADPLALVNNARTRDVLLDLVDAPSGQGRLAYNLRSLKFSTWMPNKKETIEFRQHESTVEAERVLHWIKLCVSLVEFARTIPFQVLEPFLQAHIDDSAEDFSIVQLLKAIGLPSQMLFYGMSLPQQDVQPEEQNQQQQEKEDRTPTSSQNGSTDAKPVDREVRMKNVIEEIGNRQPVQKPASLGSDGFEDIPL